MDANIERPIAPLFFSTPDMMYDIIPGINAWHKANWHYALYVIEYIDMNKW